jgi:hypothetical protein
MIAYVEHACKTCVFLVAGTCRRYPPLKGDRYDSYFPYTDDDWWCGEYVVNR